MRRIYPLYSLRDWREAAGEAQARANVRRAREEDRIDWIGASILAGVIVVALDALRIVFG